MLLCRYRGVLTLADDQIKEVMPKLRMAEELAELDSDWILRHTVRRHVSPHLGEATRCPRACGAASCGAAYADKSILYSIL